MAGAAFIASSRGTFDSAAKTLTLTVPASAVKGDVLIALVSHGSPDDSADMPAGWAMVDQVLGTNENLDPYVRMVDDTEPPSVVFSLTMVSSEWRGELVVVRGTSPGVVGETTAFVPFAAATALPTAGATSQQAINLILGVWACSGAPALTLPAGFTPVDNFHTAVVTPRSLLVGYRLAGATGALTFPGAVAGSSTTGDAFTLVVRDRVPVRPAELGDIVPGNIGLIGKDTRRAR